jgi:dTDP-4-amino-4,6-dideoxygalactose transaminase
LIPFLDVKATYNELQSEIEAAIFRVLNSGQYVSGPEVEAFEIEWANYCEASFAVGVANGLDALRLALCAMNVGPGDEVIVPAHTFIATWLAVSQVGARPVPVEPADGTYSIDPFGIEKVITQKTKVILPVHLYGEPVDIDPILDIAKRYNLRVLEDAAQAHGARYKGRRIGSHGDAVAWSFYPGKNLGAFGDGGAVTTNDQTLAERIRLLGNYGSRVKYVYDERGVNSRLDPIQAVILREKLKHLDKWNERRVRISEIYIDELRNSLLTTPTAPTWSNPVWHLFVVQAKERDKLAQVLEVAGIGSLVHYPIPPHLQHAYKDLHFKSSSFKRTELLAKEVISLPIGPHMSSDQVEHVCKICKAHY